MNPIKNFLKKSVLMAVATASLVTVANFSNFSGNNVANVAHADYLGSPNLKTPKWTQDDNPTGNLANPNAPLSQMPIWKTKPQYLNQNTLKYQRGFTSKGYIDGIKIEMQRNGQISSSQLPPKSWTKYAAKVGKSITDIHPELNLLFDNDLNKIGGKYGHDIKYINIKKLYRDYYHINIDKIFTKTRPANWVAKYRTHGLNPKSYTAKGYNTATIKPSNSKNEIQNKFKNIHNIVYVDQRSDSNKLDFGTKTYYKFY